ncbi:hypothetical protein HY947_02140 [Candidatus Gottesmanbacteria bacterium]|nr:hypothetical protein [Candidatus Gottesmanbacteria bacterium]
MKKKKINVLNRVMDKVVAYEEKRSSFFLWNYRLLLAIIILCIIAVGIGLYWELVYRRAFDLLTLFFEDREIIAEYWVDTLGMFFNEVPREYIVYFGMWVVIAIAIMMFTKPIREKLRRIIADIAKLRKNES